MEIHDELVNNAIDAADRKARLKEGIAEPLRAMAAGGHPELLARVKSLQRILADGAQSRAAAGESIAKADERFQPISEARGGYC